MMLHVIALAALVAAGSSNPPTTSSGPALGPIVSPALGSPANAPAAPLTPLSVSDDGSRIIETASGRVVLLRGVNIPQKTPPFRLFNSSDAAEVARYLDPLQAHGFNLVRLQFNWEALESVRGVYDTSYMEYYKFLIVELEKRGIRTLVDFHQDGFSRWSLNGCGEGFPQWAVASAFQSTPADLLSIDSIMRSNCPVWGISEELDTLFGSTAVAPWDNFVNASDPTHDAFLNMVGYVGSSLSGLSGVAAFDLINEPVKVDNAFYEAAAQRLISAGWNHSLFFVEPAFSTTPLATRPNIPNLVYSPHFYDKRIIFDPLERYLKYWINDGHLKDLISEFLKNPTTDTLNAMFSNADSVMAVIKALADRMDGAALAPAASSSIKNAMPNSNNFIQSLKKTAQDHLDNPSSQSAGFAAAFLGAVADGLIALLDVILFTPFVGVLPLLSEIASQFVGDPASSIHGFVTNANTIKAPLVIGEFGTPAESSFIPVQKHISAFMAATDVEFVGYSQWTWNPNWDANFLDGWNLEDFSMVRNDLAPRPSLIAYRPFPRATAGTPLSLITGQSSLNYTYSAVANGVTEIYFNAPALCGGSMAPRLQTTAGVACTLNGVSSLSCASANAGNQTIDVFC